MAVHTGGGDESFTEYVSVRWSMLYRLAVVLVGPERAGEVTEEALVRAHVSWRQLRRAASVDAAVKKVLVSAALAGGGAPPGDTARGEGSELWRRISTLPPRERAVIVLLYYEQLSEGEVARVLGWSARTVKAEAFAALANHIDLAEFTTQEVREELQLRADGAEVPPPQADSLVARGHRDRRHRVRRALSWTATGAAIVVVGGLLVSVVDDPGPGSSGTPRPTPTPLVLPVSLANLPEGDPTEVAYSERRTLHVGERQVPLAGRPSAIAQTPTAVFVAYPDGRIDRVDVETLAVELVTDSATGSVRADPGGSFVAWQASGTGQARVLVLPVDPAGAVADEQTFPATPTCCDNPFVVHGITRSGLIVGSLPEAGRAWFWDTAGGDVTEIEGLGNGVIHDVTASEVVVHHPPFHYGAGALQGGFFLVSSELQARSVDFWDPRGRRVVYVDRNGESHVSSRSRRARARGGGEVRLRLPGLDAGFAALRWEDDEHVLLDVSDDLVPQGALVRCDVDSGACEVAVRFGGPHLLAR